MILIIESGATKADWSFSKDGNELSRHASVGINPVSNDNAHKLENPSSHNPEEVTAIHYYGAGVMGDAPKKMVSDTLRGIFPNAKNIDVGTDLLASARATSAGQASIVSILGTGSNSCLFDGEQISTQLPSLGYLLGDEGSGFHIGKEVIKSYFYGDMPEGDRERFEQSYTSELSSLLMELYRSEKPNFEVASYAKFLQTAEPAYQNYLLEKIFQNFIDARIKPIQQGSNLPINFTGSISHFYAPILTRVCEMNGYRVNAILQKPMDKLIEFHNKN